MCDYCDCRRIPEIAELGAEHDRIEDLADEVFKAMATGTPSAASTFRQLIAELTAHVAREETGVFVEARAAGLGAHYVDDLEDDHRRFDAVLTDPDVLDLAAVEQLFDELHRHIAVEEYDLFPAVAQVLSATQWERISSAGRTG